MVRWLNCEKRGDSFGLRCCDWLWSRRRRLTLAVASFANGPRALPRVPRPGAASDCFAPGKGRWTIPPASSIVSGSPGDCRVAANFPCAASAALCRCLVRPLLARPVRRSADIADIRKSVVRVTTTSQDPDYKVPWNPGNIERGVGAGFIIAGPRIITNAHVISNARFVTVERENDPKSTRRRSSSSRTTAISRCSTCRTRTSSRV